MRPARSAQTGSVDLASCATPNTIEVVKKLPSVAPSRTDQATLSITGSGISSGNTGVTAGTDTGPQTQPAETAGPVIGLPGNTYSIAESGNGAGASYAKSWACVNQATGASIANGAGTSGTFAMPDQRPAGRGYPSCARLPTTPGCLTSATRRAPMGRRRPTTALDTLCRLQPTREHSSADARHDDRRRGRRCTDRERLGRRRSRHRRRGRRRVQHGRLGTGTAGDSVRAGIQAGFLNGWIDFNRDGDFDEGSERVFSDRAVVTGVNRLTYSVPDEPAFVGGDTAARFRLTSAAGQATSPTGNAPNGEVEDYLRTLYDAEAAALAECPRGSFPTPVGIIQNQSFENRTGPFVNSGSPNTINFAEHWFDKHTAGGQYLLFRPDFDSGPPESATWPWRAGADGYGFLGGHSINPGDIGEGATNTLAEPMIPGAVYVGFFSSGAGSSQRNGSGYMKMFGVDNVNIGSIAQTGVIAHSATNSEALFDTPVVSPAPAGTRPQWKLSTFELRPSQPWPYFRVEARNAVPANNNTVAGQAWINFDDFHLYLCDPIRDFGDAPASYGTVLGNNPAFHEVPDFDDDDATAPLMLGDSLDVEDDGLAGVAADGDDADAADDEDAVGAVSFPPGTTSPSVDVSVTNTTGGPATLHGWIDADGDGAFQADEHASANVPAGATSAALQWAGLPALAANSQPYLRLRLTTDNLTDNGATTTDERARGAASDGEVEDHLAAVVGGSDYGDAPDTYGTLSGSNGAAHSATGPQLGANRDDEVNGAPNTAATGDDTIGVDDEDGVEFNPALGYPNPTIRTGPDPTTLLPVVNNIIVNASAAGFASVWVDWNQDGDFTDTDERVADAQPVTAGDNNVTFVKGTNPRAASGPTSASATAPTRSAIHSPTGTAPDGEVEDYRGMVERLISPASCTPLPDPYYAISVATSHRPCQCQPGERVWPVPRRHGGRWSRSGPGCSRERRRTQWQRSSYANGDSRLDRCGQAKCATKASVRAGTNTPIAVNGVFMVNDMDRFEVAGFYQDELEGRAIPPRSTVVVTEDTVPAGDRYLFRGTWLATTTREEGSRSGSRTALW